MAGMRLLSIPRLNSFYRHFLQSIIRSTERGTENSWRMKCGEPNYQLGHMRARRDYRAATKAIVALATEEGQMAEHLAKKDRCRNEALTPEMENWLTWLIENWKTHFAEDRPSPSDSSSTSWHCSCWTRYSKWTWKDDDRMEDKW